MTTYTFRIESFVSHPLPVKVHSSTAEVELVPNPDGKNEFTTARVTVPSAYSVGLMECAHRELMKVLLRHACPQARILRLTGGGPVVDWDESEQDTLEAGRKPQAGRSLLFKGRSVASYNPDAKRTLKIDLDSNSPAIYCYFESMKRDDPVDMYRELFRIVEYFSGVKPRGVRNRQHILEHLNKTLWIPSSARVVADNVQSLSCLSDSNLTERLISVRDECSHLRPNYGLVPAEPGGVSRVNEVLGVVREIVKYTLENNSETKERHDSV